MKGPENRDKETALRGRAEDRIKVKGKELEQELEKIPDKKMRELMNELYVHQEELRMQNEELRAAQEVLERSRERLSDLYDFAPCGYVTLDRDGKILEANLTIASMLGRKRNQLVNKPLNTAIIEQDRDIFYMHLREIYKKQARQVCTLRLLRNDDSPIYVEIVSNLHEDSEGTFLCRSSIIDVSDRKKLEEVAKKYSNENERILKIMVGRELDAGSLREENEALKAEIKDLKEGQE